jgi:hypothetical protein
MSQSEIAWTSAWDAGQEAHRRNLTGANWFHHVSNLSDEEARAEATRLNLTTVNKTHRRVQTDLLASEGRARVAPPPSSRGAWLLDRLNLFYWQLPQ